MKKRAYPRGDKKKCERAHNLEYSNSLLERDREQKSNTPLEESDGTVIGVLSMVQDITESKRAEAALLESEEKYRKLVEQSLVGVLVIQDDAIKFMNKTGLSIIGYTEEEVIGSDFRKYVATEDMDKAVDGVRKRQSGICLSASYELKVVRKDGSKIDIAVFSSLSIYQGRPAVQGVFIDVTEKKNVERKLEQSHKELQKAYAKLEELYIRRSDFVNMAAHELRTPLVPIIGYLGILKNEIQDEKLLRYVEIMERNAKRQRKLIDRMLELSKLDAGKVELEVFSKVL